MAGVPNSQIAAGQPPVEPTDNNDLASRIAEGASFDELDQANQSAGDIDRASDQPNPQPSAPDELAKLRADIEAERTERRLERQTILGLLAKNKQAPTVVVQSPETKAVAAPQLSEAELIESLKKDPLGTIRNVARDAASQAARAVREELTGEIKNTNQRTVADLRRQDALRQSAVDVRSEFADVYGNNELREAFDLEAGQELYNMYGDDWQTKLQPSDPMSAASRVYARWARSGKLARTAPHTNGGTAAGNGGGSVRPLREIVRSAPTGGSSDRVDGSPGAPRNGDRRSPTSLSDLGYSQAEQVAARKIMKDYGMTEATWVANFLQAQSDDPSFGKG